MNRIIEYKYNLVDVKKQMKDIAEEHGIKLIYLKPDEGEGGYNYGISTSTGDEILLAPYIKGKAGDKIGKYTLSQSCDNPVECMFISFFHELSHCRLADDSVPMRVKGYRWNGTSDYQYELWVTMLGLEYAQRNYNIVFSDQSVQWLLKENDTRISNNWKDPGSALVQKKPTIRTYSVVGWAGPQ